MSAKALLTKDFHSSAGVEGSIQAGCYRMLTSLENPVQQPTICKTCRVIIIIPLAASFREEREKKE